MGSYKIKKRNSLVNCSLIKKYNFRSFFFKTYYPPIRSPISISKKKKRFSKTSLIKKKKVSFKTYLYTASTNRKSDSYKKEKEKKTLETFFFKKMFLKALT